jgi:hypothetical protein
MILPTHYVERLQAFGYTEDEARFLYIAATHSGYFTVRQFLAYTQARRGNRSQNFTNKLLAQGHASMQRHSANHRVYHLCSRHLYAAIGKDDLRHRRTHESGYVRARLLGLEFILARAKEFYFERHKAKRDYFCEELGISDSVLPQRRFFQQGTLKRRYFADDFPLALSFPGDSSSPVVTFTYIDTGHHDPDCYAAHIRTYMALFRQLRCFRFVYISTPGGFFTEAQPLFSLLLDGQVQTDLQRYFTLRRRWEGENYRLLTDTDLIFLKGAEGQFQGKAFDRLYFDWKQRRLPRAFQANSRPTEKLCPIVAFETFEANSPEPIFGAQRNPWGERRSKTGVTLRGSPLASPGAQSEVRTTEADA